MRKKIAIFFVLSCCVICLDDQSIAILASPRVMLVYMLALWLCCERCVQNKCKATKEPMSMYEAVKENYKLSQTVMNLSEQHRLLCEIRSTGLKSLRYSKDTFVELKFPSTKKSSFNSSLKSTPSSESTQESKENTPESKASETHQPVPSLVETDNVLKSKTAFRRRSVSEHGLTLLGGKKAKEL